MADRSLRGIRLGAQSLQSEEGVVFMERRATAYKCDTCGQETTLMFAADAEAPQTWECRHCGAEAVLQYSYAGTVGLLQGDGMASRFFHRLGATQLARTICASAGKQGLIYTLGRNMGMDALDFEHSRLIWLWGTNTLTSNLHLWPVIQRAHKAGAKVVVIDLSHAHELRFAAMVTLEELGRELGARGAELRLAGVGKRFAAALASANSDLPFTLEDAEPGASARRALQDCVRSREDG